MNERLQAVQGLRQSWNAYYDFFTEKFLKDNPNLKDSLWSSAVNKAEEQLQQMDLYFESETEDEKLSRLQNVANHIFYSEVLKKVREYIDVKLGPQEFWKPERTKVVMFLASKHPGYDAMNTWEQSAVIDKYGVDYYKDPDSQIKKAISLGLNFKQAYPSWFGPLFWLIVVFAFVGLFSLF